MLIINEKSIVVIIDRDFSKVKVKEYKQIKNETENNSLILI